MRRIRLRCASGAAEVREVPEHSTAITTIGADGQYHHFHATGELDGDGLELYVERPLEAVSRGPVKPFPRDER